MAAGVGMVALLAGCAVPTVRSTGTGAPSRELRAQLWVDPGRTPRNLEAGAGGMYSIGGPSGTPATT